MSIRPENDLMKGNFYKLSRLCLVAKLLVALTRLAQAANGSALEVAQP